METSKNIDSIESPIAIIKTIDTKTKINEYYILVRYNREYPYTKFDRFLFCVSKKYNNKKALLDDFVNNNVEWLPSLNN